MQLVVTLSLRLMSIGGENFKKLCKICADACFACREECSKHTNSNHCQECAETCGNCAEECRKMDHSRMSYLNSEGVYISALAPINCQIVDF